MRYEASSAIARGTIKPTQSTIKITGASFSIPDTLKDDVESFRNSIPTDVLKKLPLEIPREAFILANDESLYLVFAQRIDKGLATVEGWMLPVNATFVGLKINVIVAKSVIFEKQVH